MREEASLRRLAEMGIDVYLPRGARHEAAAATHGTDAAEPARSASAPVHAVVFADGSASTLSAHVARSLGFARVACVPAGEDAEAVLADAAMVIMFGAAQARRAGALVPAPRQQELAWLVTAETASLRGDARARRALWSELKRLVRGLAQRRDPARR